MHRTATLILKLALGLWATVPLQAQVVSGSSGAGAAAGGQASRGTRLTQLPLVAAQGSFGPVEVDTSVGGAAAGDGNPLTIEGRVFQSGLGTAATSLVTYDLRGAARVFTSWVGVDDEVGAGGSVVFQVFGDGQLLFDSGLRTGGDPALFTGRIGVNGVRELQLVVLDGGDGAALDHADWADPFLFVPSGLTTGGNGGGSRYVRGAWEAPLSWPLQPIHATLLASGQILSHASVLADEAGTDAVADPHDSTRADLATVATWGHQPVDHPTQELYAAGHARSARGELIVFGGHAGRDAALLPFGRAQASRFDEARASWIPVADLQQARWGAAGLTLGDGGLLALGGAHAGGNAHRPELFDGCAWRLLPGVDTFAWWNNNDPQFDDTYPFAHLASDGRVFVSGWDEDMAFLDPRGAGEWSNVFQREPFQRLFGTAVAYGTDRVLLAGGVDHQGNFGDALRSSLSVDFSGAAPVATASGALLFPRADANATLLADGSVFLHGGAVEHAAGASPSHVRVPEIWDPLSGTWSVAAQSSVPRGYRSSALLLPDGRVWTGGGECGAGCTSGETAEVFRPPYLYLAQGGGALAPRPTIVGAPSRVDYGMTFDLSMSTSAALTRVTCVRAGSATHGVDFDQRFLELGFTQSGSLLTVDAPAHGNLAPPGPYLVFVFDASGVPSVGARVLLGEASPATWQLQTASDGSTPAARHETSMVAVGGRFYLIGGRGQRRVQEYDPVTRRWINRSFPPQEIHHFQPVVIDGLVYVVGAFIGNYPFETPLGNMLIYDPLGDAWSVGPAMPPARGRGSAGAVIYDGDIYFVGGNTLGHNGGAVAWLDVYDPDTNTWTALPDAPHARDHFMAAVVGNKLVAAGGRTTDLPNPFDGTVSEVDVYDFSTGAWSTLANDLPTPRAGAMTVSLGQYVVVAGGESDVMNDAHDDVEALDVLMGEWHTLPALMRERHSAGVAVHHGRIHVASGSGDAGGSPELTTFEMLGAADVLAGLSTNPVANAGFDAGLADWGGAGELELASVGGVKSPALALRNGDALQFVSASGGATYELSAVFRAAGSGTAEIGLAFLDGSNSVVGQNSLALPAVTQFTSVRVIGAAPAGTATIRIRLQAGGGRELIVDDVALRIL